MKKKIHKIILILSGIILFSCMSIRNETVKLKSESQELLSKKIEIQIPTPFHIQKENYEEGVIYYYSFADSALIVICQGSMVEFPMDKYIVSKTIQRKNTKIFVGEKNNKYWRKDVYEGVRVYYDNVSPNNKKLYDKALNEMKINPL